MKSRNLAPLLFLVLTGLAFILACGQQDAPAAPQRAGTPGVGAAAGRASDTIGTGGVEPAFPLTPTTATVPTGRAVASLRPSATRAPSATIRAATPAPPPAADADGFELFFLDVGQGDATLIVASTGETLLIDGGGSKTRIRERLRDLGVFDLDAIVATHPDADHIAGLVEVLELFSVERIYLNGGQSRSQTFVNFMVSVYAEGAEVVMVTLGDTIPLGELLLRVLHPWISTGDSNADSMVLLLDCGEIEVLLTGGVGAVDANGRSPIRHRHIEGGQPWEPEQHISGIG